MLSKPSPSSTSSSQQSRLKQSPRLKKAKAGVDEDASKTEDNSSVGSIDVSLGRKGAVKAKVNNGKSSRQPSVLLQSDVFFPKSQLADEYLESLYCASSFYERHDGGDDSARNQFVETMVASDKNDDKDKDVTKINTSHSEKWGYLNDVEMSSKVSSCSTSGKESNELVTLALNHHDYGKEMDENIDTMTSSLSVLVVDDSYVDRKISQKCLSGKYGQVMCAVHTAENGEMALQYCSSSSSYPDVIIIDQNMESSGGVLLGTEVVKNLRVQYGLRDVIIIGCTGFGDTVKQTLLTSGCDAVWQKPIPNRDEAMALIQKIRYERIWKRSQDQLRGINDVDGTDVAGDSLWSEGVKSAIDSVLRKGNLQKHVGTDFAWNDDWGHIPRLSSYICNHAVYADSDCSEETNKPVNFVEIQNNLTEVVSELSCSVVDNNSEINDVISEVAQSDADFRKVVDHTDNSESSETSTRMLSTLSANDIPSSHFPSDISLCDSESKIQSEQKMWSSEGRWDPVFAFKSAFTRASVNADKLQASSS